MGENGIHGVGIVVARGDAGRGWFLDRIAWRPCGGRI